MIDWLIDWNEKKNYNVKIIVIIIDKIIID